MKTFIAQASQRICLGSIQGRIATARGFARTVDHVEMHLYVGSHLSAMWQSWLLEADRLLKRLPRPSCQPLPCPVVNS